MPARRIALFAAALLIAAGALFLIVRGFRGADAPPGAPEAAPEETATGGRAEEKPPPRWQSFMRPDEREAPPPRPVVRLAQQDLPSPFDRLPEGGGVTNGGGGGDGAKPENPGLRLEGISVGARTVALISGHAVREGGAISGFRVVRIGRSAVTLAGPRGARLNLTLEGGGR